MSLYKEVQKELEVQKANEQISIDRSDELMLSRYEEIENYLKDFGLEFRLEWDGWFKRIQIDLVPNNDSAYYKSHIKILPSGNVVYQCGHYSAGGWSCTEVLSESTDVEELTELLGLIKKDIKEALRFVK